MSQLFSKSKHWYKRLDWTNVLFLGGAHIAAIGGLWFMLSRGNIHPATWVLTIFMFAAAGLGITAGYHRLFAHKTYEAGTFVKLLWLLFGAAAFQNSARMWSSDHRRHHKYVDTDRDPYNIKEGFLFAHIGWVLLRYQEDYSYDDVPDLINDRLVMMQEKYYAIWAVGMGLVFPTLVASIWGDPLGGFFLAGWFRIVLNEHFTFSINSFSHYFGTQPYNDSDTSRDNWFFALFTYGEGYHNFHHKFPFDYRNGIKFHQWDPSKWIIRAFSWFGLTKKLKTTPHTTVLKAKLAMDEKRLIKNLEKPVFQTSPVTREIVSAAREKFEKAYFHLQTLKKDYEQLKTQKLQALNEQLTSINEKIEQRKKELAQARASLHEAMMAWSEICQGFGVRPTRAVV